jgi:protein-S-isoprenylcysteine O-methyltransferase Ste14
MGWVLLFGVMAAQFFYPLFWQQEKPALGLILRNSFVLAIRHPLYTILILLFQGVLIVLSILLVVPVVLLLPGMIALAQNHALVGLLQDMDLAPQPPVLSGT